MLKEFGQPLCSSQKTNILTEFKPLVNAVLLSMLITASLSLLKSNNGTNGYQLGEANLSFYLNGREMWLKDRKKGFQSSDPEIGLLVPADHGGEQISTIPLLKTVILNHRQLRDLRFRKGRSVEEIHTWTNLGYWNKYQ